MKIEKLACAVYTRKSSEEGLEQGFNSLDAQREACEAYILSQKAMGWTQVQGSYDDGGFSGGNVERPGLQRLLADIAAKRVQVVVVYKVDRLTRSLADFAKMVELFDSHGVSFVSITQQFNTTTSMGRLTLNVLLSFAQFEREVTGERIRDKIAASKRKGMWMGGLASIGYTPKDRTLVIVEDQAEMIRAIYRLYLELNCVSKLKKELDRRHWVTPERKSPKAGVKVGNRPFCRGHLHRILCNPLFIGQIEHDGQTYPGQHAAIIDMELWQAVQDRLTANRQGQKTKTHAAEPSLLAGILIDGKGRGFTPSHAKKGNRRYRYYNGPEIQREGDEADCVRLPAREIEAVVVDAMVRWLKDESGILALVSKAKTRNLHAKAIQELLQRVKDRAEELQQSPRSHLSKCVQQVMVMEESVRIDVHEELLSTLGLQQDEGEPHSITVPAKLKRCGNAVRLIVRASSAPTRKVADTTLQTLLNRAFDWFERLTCGACDGIGALAIQEGVSQSYAARVIYLALLAPDIVQKITRQEHPHELNAERLMRLSPLPADWGEQRVLLGMA